MYGSFFIHRKVGQHKNKNDLHNINKGTSLKTDKTRLQWSTNSHLIR